MALAGDWPTVKELAEDALIDLGVLAAGETASAADIALATRKFNYLVDQWAAERLFIFAIVATEWSITGSAASYTIGPNFTIDIGRPDFIQAISYYDPAISPQQEVELRLLTHEEWQAITQKDLTAVYPTRAYFDRAIGESSKIWLWPVPTATLTGVLYVPTALGKLYGYTAPPYSSITGVVVPAGYHRMIVKNLAVDMAAAFGRPVTRELVLAANYAKNVVKSRNVPVRDISFEWSSGAQYDIKADE